MQSKVEYKNIAAEETMKIQFLVIIEISKHRKGKVVAYSMRDV